MDVEAVVLLADGRDGEGPRLGEPLFSITWAEFQLSLLLCAPCKIPIKNELSNLSVRNDLLIREVQSS